MMKREIHAIFEARPARALRVEGTGGHGASVPFPIGARVNLPHGRGPC